MSEQRVGIHTSDKTKFKGCRLEWDFSSILRRGYRPGIAELPLGFGASIHSGLEALKDPRSASFPEDARLTMAIGAFLVAWRSMRVDAYGTPLLGYEDEYREYKELGIGMLTHYAMWTKQNTNKILMVEVPFEVPILSPANEPLLNHAGFPIVYKGKIDAIEEDENGYWVVDYKTVGRWNPEEDLYAYLQRDDQTGGYCYATRKVLGLPIQGVIYEQLYKGVPQKPQVLSRPRLGRMLSTNKTQDTSYDLYLQAIAETHEPVELYEDILTYLREGGGPQYFRRIVIRKSTAELEYIGRQIYMEAKAMTDPDVDIYHTASYFGCKYCSYKSPCEAVMRGEDPEPILKANFIHTKEHYVDYSGTG